MRMKHWTRIMSAALLAAAGQAAAQTPPPSPPPPPAAAAPAEAEEDDSDEIVVTAPENETRIDRRTYTVRNDPAAQANSALDILGRIPSVNVTPQGAIRLLGTADVAIQINGQPVPAQSIDQVLRTLTGGDVERIEVITNPSATQSATSAAGIINIITRERFNAGFSGTAQALVDTLGSWQANVSPTWTQGPWTVGGRLAFIHNIGDNDLERERETFATGVITSEAGVSEFENDQSMGNLQLGYRIDDRRRLNFTLDHFEFDGDFDQILARSNTLIGPLSTQTNIGRNEFSNDRLWLSYQRSGGEQQGTLKLTSFVEQIQSDAANIITLGPAGGGPIISQFNSPTGQDTLNGSIKLDYERATQEPRRALQLGAAYDYTDQELLSGFQTLVGVPGPADYRSVVNGEQHTLAGYATYQFTTGDWTWQPGVRVEGYWREVESGGVTVEDEDARVFPSIHLRRKLSQRIDLDLSYSSRIQRPVFQQLDPTVRFLETNRAYGGNPNLKPSTTDAYEANLTYQSGSTSYGVTFFDRISEDIMSPFTTVTPGGVLLQTSVNAGQSEQRGLQLIMRAPLWWDGWRYSLSANVQDRAFDVLRNGAIERRNEFEYGGNAQIEWRDANQNAVNADSIQFDVQFQGPRHQLQNEADEFVIANLTWRRRLTERVLSTIAWQDVFDTNEFHSSVTTDDYFETVEGRGVEPRVRFSLSYQFGTPSARPQQPQDQPPPLSGPPPQ